MGAFRTFILLIAVLASAMALALSWGEASPTAEELEQIPVRGTVSPEGAFAGHLTIVEFSVDATDQIHLTGVLSGTATQRRGTTTQVAHQVFSAPARQLDWDRTTDVLRLQIGPIALTPVEGQVLLAPVTLDIYAVPDDGNALARLLDRK